LLTRIATLRPVRAIASNVACTDFASVTSQACASALVSKGIRCTASYSRERSRPSSDTDAPIAASRVAMASPMPRPAPVTTACIPARG
jgi:hypothetical protein